MGSPYIGEIRLFGGNFAPQNWSFCDGSLLLISEFEPLFNLIGTTYGGDGQNTFALPDLRGRVPVHVGQGNGLSVYVMGQRGGVENVLLATSQIPAHTHALSGATQGTSVSAVNRLLSTDPGGAIAPYFKPPLNNGRPGTMNSNAIGASGGGTPHDNLQPFVAITYIISLFGIFPSQS
jgi:microcystin-dependent protein